MREIVTIYFWLFVAYLLADKFLFKGMLATLFVGGWNEFLGGQWDRVRRLSCRVFKTELKENVEQTEPEQTPDSPLEKAELIVTKNYAVGITRNGADAPENIVQPIEKSDTLPSHQQIDDGKTTNWKRDYTKPEDKKDGQLWDSKEFTDEIIYTPSNYEQGTENDVETRSINHVSDKIKETVTELLAKINDDSEQVAQTLNEEYTEFAESMITDD